MRIAYLVSKYPKPSHTFIRREIEALRDRGVDLRVMSIRRPMAEEVLSGRDEAAIAETFYVFPPSLPRAAGALARRLRKAPLDVARAFWTSQTVRDPGPRGALFGVFYFLEGCMLAEEIERAGIEHVHCHFANAASHAAMAATEMSGASFSLTLHGLGDVDTGEGGTLASKVEKARFIACATQYGRAQTMRISDRDQWDKIVVVRCGIELDALPPRQPRPPGRRFRFVCVSRLSPEKGQLGLLQAFSEAKAEGLDAELVLVGGGPLRETLEAEVARLGLERDVQFRGRVSEADALAEVAAADASIISSYVEGLPVALMESLGIGIPVIAPRITGIPELVEDGVTGLLFTVGQWSELAQRMREVVDEPEKASRMAATGQARVVAEYDARRAVEPLAERFES
ncbi:MAG: glycosyltransferase family 4 protein [Myxococcota bacterium]